MAPRISTAVAALAAGCTALSATTRPLRIGTRGSPLALAQAYMTRQLLMDNFEELSSEGAIQLVRSCFFLTSDCIMCNVAPRSQCIMKTQGDMILDKVRRQRSYAFANNSSHLNSCRR